MRKTIVDFQNRNRRQQSLSLCLNCNTCQFRVLRRILPLARKTFCLLVEIIPTTRDKLDDATNAPNTASVLEEEDHKGIVEHKYIIRNEDVTIDNDEVRDEVDKKSDSNTVRLEMFSEL